MFDAGTFSPYQQPRSAGGNGAGDFGAFWSSLTPDQQQQIMGLGAIPEKQQQLDEQMALAQHMLGQGPQRSSPIGAAFQGLADIGNRGKLGHVMNSLQGQKSDLTEQGTGGRMEYAKALAAYLGSAMSDERLKTDIVRLPVEILPGVPLAEWTWKATGKRARGVIAQDLARVAPEFVLRGADGWLRVNYVGLGMVPTGA